MAFKIPQPIVSYSNPMAVQPSRSFLDPSEGKSFIPIEIDWAGNGSTQQINVQGIGTKPFSQIVMLDVDNTQSGADTTFYFPDSTDTLVVPAYSAGLFPVFTSGLNFYVAAPAALASDITRFRILNYRQEPVGNPPPEFHNVASATGFGAIGTTALIPAGVSGTLDGYSLFGNVVETVGGIDAWIGKLVDHATGAVIDQFEIQMPSVTGTFWAGSIWNVSGAAIRFSSGLDLVVATQSFGFANGTISLRYRNP